MKKVFSVLFLTVLVLSASAQIKRNKKSAVPADSAVAVSDVSASMDDKKMKKGNMFKELNLSKPQMKQLKVIKQDGKAQKSTIENNTQLSEVEKQKQLKELKVAQLKKTQAVLTPEQLEKFKQLRKQSGGAKMEMADDEME